MSSVNFPPSAVVGELVPEGMMQQQLRDALGSSDAQIAAHVDPASAVAPAIKLGNMEPEPEPDEEDVEDSVFHALQTSLMITLDLSQPNTTGLRKALSTVDGEDGAPYNLYSPFRRGAKPKAAGDAPAVDGVLRSSISDIFDITDKLNTSRIMFVGDDDRVAARLNSTVQRCCRQMKALLPFDDDSVVCELASEDPDAEAGDEPDVIEIQFSDIVKVTAWVNSPQTVGSVHDVDIIAEHNAVVNIKAAAGALYDSEEKMKYIGQVETQLRLIASKRDIPGATVLLFAVLLNPADLAGQETRDLLDIMIGDSGYKLYTRHELHQCDLAGWLPMTAAEVDSALLTNTGDLLLVKLLDTTPLEDGGAEPAAVEPA